MPPQPKVLTCPLVLADCRAATATCVRMQVNALQVGNRSEQVCPASEHGRPIPERHHITEGGLTGQRGYFSRDANGATTGVDLAGRFLNRVAEAS